MTNNLKKLLATWKNLSIIAGIAFSSILLNSCEEHDIVPDQPEPPIINTDSIAVNIANTADLHAFIQSKKKNGAVYCVAKDGALPVLRSNFDDLEQLNTLKNSNIAIVNNGAGLLICPAASNVALTMAEKEAMGVKITNAADTTFLVPKNEEQQFKNDPDNKSSVPLRCYNNSNQTVNVNSVNDILNNIDELSAAADAGNTVVLAIENDMPINDSIAYQLEKLSSDNIKKNGIGILEAGEELVVIDGGILLKFNSVEPEMRAGMPAKSNLRASTDAKRNWFYVPSRKGADKLIGNKYGIRVRSDRRNYGLNSRADLNYVLPDTLQQSGEAIDARGLALFDSLQVNTLVIPEAPETDITMGYTDDQSLSLVTTPSFDGTSDFVKVQKDPKFGPKGYWTGYRELSYKMNIKDISDVENGNGYEKLKKDWFDSQQRNESGSISVFYSPFGAQKDIYIKLSESPEYLSEDGLVILNDHDLKYLSSMFGLVGDREFSMVHILNKHIALALDDDNWGFLQMKGYDFMANDIINTRFTRDNIVFDSIPNIKEVVVFLKASDLRKGKAR